MYIFEYIISIYKTFIEEITEVKLHAINILNKYGGM